ncbi:hypothetical protein JXA12_05770 [Candidatus Woesearchaeota archaeon]|nr:hypothetical protein [Candidatus Woesearchaeota archaeon]
MKQEVKQLMVYVPKTIHNRLRQHSKKVGINMSALAKLALHQYLENEANNDERAQ